MAADHVLFYRPAKDRLINGAPDRSSSILYADKRNHSLVVGVTSPRIGSMGYGIKNGEPPLIGSYRAMLLLDELDMADRLTPEICWHAANPRVTPAPADTCVPAVKRAIGERRYVEIMSETPDELAGAIERAYRHGVEVDLVEIFTEIEKGRVKDHAAVVEVCETHARRRKRQDERSLGKLQDPQLVRGAMERSDRFMPYLFTGFDEVVDPNSTIGVMQQNQGVAAAYVLGNAANGEPYRVVAMSLDGTLRGRRLAKVEIHLNHGRFPEPKPGEMDPHLEQIMNICMRKQPDAQVGMGMGENGPRLMVKVNDERLRAAADKIEGETLANIILARGDIKPYPWC